MIIGSKNKDIGETIWAWDRTGGEPKVVKYDESNYPEIRPEGMDLRQQLFEIGNVVGYKNINEKILSRTDKGPVFFGKLKKKKKKKKKEKKKEKKKRTSRLKKLSQRAKSKLDSLTEKKKKKTSRLKKSSKKLSTRVKSKLDSLTKKKKKPKKKKKGSSSSRTHRR